MINPIRNICDYCKYGKKVYESANGKVIRKKVNYPTLFENNGREVCTTKTILNNQGKVENTIVRCSHNDGDTYSSFVRKTKYDTELGTPIRKGSTNIDYIIEKGEKRIINNSKPGYDYRIITMADGTQLYEIAYPEITTIKDGVVKRVQNNKIVKCF